MSESISEREFRMLEMLPAHERYEYFIERVKREEFVWGLASEDGWIVSDTEQGRMLPVWPYERFAQSCARKDLAHTKAKSVELNYFIDEVLRRLANQGIGVHVFPTLESDGEMMSAFELQQALQLP